MNRILFLCSGNYYRSRFAEYLFNHLAESSVLGWRANSRGLAVGLAGNIGPISRYTIERLHALGISINDNPKLPRQLTETDLMASDIIIALKEAEHRPLVAHLFPAWMERIDYWHIDDLDFAEPGHALSVLEGEVRALVGRLEMSVDRNPAGARAELPFADHSFLCVSPVTSDC